MRRVGLALAIVLALALALVLVAMAVVQPATAITAPAASLGHVTFAGALSATAADMAPIDMDLGLVAESPQALAGGPTTTVAFAQPTTGEQTANMAVVAALDNLCNFDLTLIGTDKNDAADLNGTLANGIAGTMPVRSLEMQYTAPMLA